MNTIQIEGNLTADPIVRRSPKGKTFVTFRIAENQGYRDEGGRWVDMPPLFLSVIVNGKAAQNAAATLRRGHGVIVNGTLVDGSWVDDQGVRHAGVRLKARAIGPSLSNATAQVTRNPKAEPTQAELEPAAALAEPEPAAEPAKPAAKRTRAAKRSKPAATDTAAAEEAPAEQERPAA